MSVLAVLFLAGVYRLFQMRFAVGDVYPVYSSLRADPLGTKVFFESLEESGIPVRRNYNPESRMQPSGGRTFYFIGVRCNSLEIPEAESRRIDRAVEEGGRFVVMLYPGGLSSAPAPDKVTGKAAEARNSVPKAKEKKQEKKKEKPEEKDLYAPKLVSLPGHWGFKIGDMKAGGTAGSGNAMTAVAAKGAYGLPRNVSWHSGLFFADCKNGWKTLYEVKGKPVMMVRHFGSGEIVLASDSYLVSNEAMFKERHPALLSFLLGRSSCAVFDESHLGITKNSGVAGLMMQYHLGGLMAGLFLLGILFIWKNSISLVPPRPDAGDEDSIQGTDNVGGLVNLLKRNIPPDTLLEVCYREWKKTQKGNFRATREREVEIQDLIRKEKSLPPKKQDPVWAYKTVEKILSERSQ